MGRLLRCRAFKRARSPRLTHIEGVSMILVTGGMGFIGLHTARKLLDAGQDVVLTYHNTRREPEIIKDEIGKRVFPEQVDVTDPARLNEIAEAHKIDSIVHLVAP